MNTCQICGGSNFADFARDGEHDWLRCRDCEFIFLSQMPELSDAANMQDETVAEAYIGGYLKKFDSKMRRSRRRAQILKSRMIGPRLLDVGSNIGCLVAAASDIGLEPTGIEPNLNLVKFAEKKFPGRRFVCGTLEAAHTNGALFNGIYCSEVIEHSVDVNNFMAKIASLLGRGGVLYLTTPHIREYIGWNRRPRSDALGAPDHKVYFNNENLKHLLTRHGFHRVEFKFNFRRGIKLLAVKT